jgi:carboxypeptidase C (cathepsin A)
MIRAATLWAATALLVLSGGVSAQQPQPAPTTAEQPARPETQGAASAGRRGPETRRLPPDSVTEHALELPGRTLRFTATAGSIQLSDGQGNLQAEIAFTAYTLPGADAATRPVTFAVNGGPGAASAYLHLGALGPWRLPLDGSVVSASATPALVPNAETWLDFTDLVFIDPVGTGYSRGVGSGEELTNRFFTVESDIESLGEVVARWLRARDRMAVPKFFIGESYGGFRGPLLAEKLREGHGAALSGIVLLSPVLDFGWFSQPRHAPWPHVTRLPSYAAAALEAKGGVTREALRDAESYASGEYLLDLMRGLQDRAAVERVSGRVAALTGLDPALVRSVAGRVEMGTFQREFRRATGRVLSAYDTGVTGLDPDPTSRMSRFEDPLLAALRPPLTSAIVDHTARTLKFRVDARYHLLNGSVNGAWRWSRGRGQPESVSTLREEMAIDGNLRTLVVHGFTDLVTPYYASHLLLNQLPDWGPERRARLEVYPGGHMFYTRDASRAAFRADAEKFFAEAREARIRAAGQ